MDLVSRPRTSQRPHRTEEPWPIPALQKLSSSLLGLLFEVQQNLFDGDGQFFGAEADLNRLARVFIKLAKLEADDKHESAKGATVTLIKDHEGGDGHGDAGDEVEDPLFGPTCALMGKPPTVNEKMVWMTLGSTFLRSVWNLVNMFIEAGATHSIALTLLIQSAPLEVDWPFPAIANVHGLLSDAKSETPPALDSTFLYKPLPSPREWLRMLVLWPAQQRTDPILCSLAFEKLSGKANYEALSYAWGDPTKTRTIYVDGRPFQATANLFEALQECRYMGKRHRVLWVDAVCINQRDIIEKSAQVQMMAKIYRQASRVVIWLGPISNTSATFWDLLEWYRAETTAWQSLNPDRDQDQFFMPLELDLSGRLAVHKFLSRPWFGRAWVIQEVILAQEAVVRCGHHEMDWETFSYFVCDFRYAYLEDAWNGVISRSIFFDEELERSYHRHNEVVNGSRLLNLPFLIVAIRTARRKNRRMNLCELLKYARLQDATDSRDKVYSILGLLDDEERAYLPKPDYSSHFLSVFSTWARASIMETSALAVLAAVHQYKEATWSLPRDLPSWVPDWRHTSRPSLDNPLMPVESLDIDQVSIFNAGLYPKSPYPFSFQVQNRVLCARGIRLGQVPTLPPGLSMNFQMGDGAALSLNKNMRSLVSDHRQALIDTGHFVRDHFWRTISWDRSSRSISKAVKRTRRIAPEGVKLRIGCQFPPRDDAEEELLLARNRDDYVDEDGYQASVIASVGAILRITSGHLGSFPLRVKQSDEVVVLFGHDKPVVLRKCCEYYIFIAEWWAIRISRISNPLTSLAVTFMVPWTVRLFGTKKQANTQSRSFGSLRCWTLCFGAATVDELKASESCERLIALSPVFVAKTVIPSAGYTRR